MAMTLRLSPDDEMALALLAETEGISKQEATIRAIHEAAERHGHSAAVESASRSARARYVDLLDRLGQ